MMVKYARVKLVEQQLIYRLNLMTHYYVVAHMFGDEVARLVCQSNHQAVDFIEQTVKKENIDCEFRTITRLFNPS